MKTRGYVTVGCMLIVLFAGASLAQAGMLFSEDFASLADGPLLGQDGWTAINSWPSPTVTNGTGAQASTWANYGGARAISLSALPSDTLVATARFYATASSGESIAGLVDANQTGTNWLPGFGISGGTTYFRDVATFDEHYGNSLTMGDTYDMRATIDLSVAGGKLTLAYRDVTLGQTAFTTDGTIVNIGMGLHEVAGKYDFNAVAIRLSAAETGSGISQYTLTSGVPEPAGIVMLVTGVFSLLAYAWRKRK